MPVIIEFLYSFSPLVRWLAAAIVLAASFMRQANSLVKAILPSWLIALLVWSGFVCSLVLVLRMLRQRRPVSTYLRIGLIFVAGLALGMTMEVTEERVHILEYGLMGFLAARDMRRHEPARLARNAMILCALLGIADELFQAILPYRVGDLRDVFFDLLSSLLGIALYLSVAGTEGAPVEEISSSTGVLKTQKNTAE